MIDFLITSSICLAIFLGFYHIVLEKEKMHVFNRFYLLSTLLISLIIPFLNFQIIKEVPAQVQKQILIENTLPYNYVIIEPESNLLTILLWSFYAIITLFFLIRFGKNIVELISKIKKNPSVDFQKAKLILLEEKTLPHTFLNSIFINSNDHNQRVIQNELYEHELVHVNQKHTIDVLIIETLKSIFWFNPLFYLYKKVIQLNHEFLADEGVVKQGSDVSYYQSLLLQKSNSNQVFITSNLNYSLTKKRLIMMTKHTSKSIGIIKKLSIIPILTVLIYCFCIDIIAQEKKASKDNTVKVVAYENNKLNKPKNATSEADYFKGVRVKYYNLKTEKLLFDKKHEALTATEKKEIETSLQLSMVKSLEKKSPSINEINDFKDNKKFAIWIDGKNVPNSNLNNFKPKDFAYYAGSSIMKNARTKKHPQPFQYWFYTHSYFEKNKMGNQLKKYPGEEITIYKDGNSQIIKPTEKSINKTGKVVVGQYNEDAQINTNSGKKVEAVAIGKEAKMELPNYNGGISEFYKYIFKNINLPKNVKEEKITASFIIEKDGTLTNATIKNSTNTSLNNEILRVLKASPKWKPAKVDNEIIRYEYVLPILIDNK